MMPTKLMTLASYPLVVCSLGFWSAATSAQLPPTPTGELASHGPRLFVPQRIQDVGTILEGDKAVITWTLENRGDADLVIDRTAASCGCTIVKLTDEEKVIPPGKSLELKAQFDSTSRREVQTKSVNVSSNDPTEPELKLEFRALVELLFELDPANLVNLRTVRRGVASTRTLDVYPGPGRKSVTIRGMEVTDDGPISLAAEPYESPRGLGQRIRITVLDSASIGTVNASMKLTLDVDGIERERTVAVRGEVIADLTWLPKVVDATRQPSLPGKRFAPVSISAAEKTPFEITGATAGPLFDCTVEPGRHPQAKTDYDVVLTLRPDAPPGPFGALLRIQTDSLDQPVLEVPVFGIVAPAVEIDPPLVLLRPDGTAAGATRRIKLQTTSPRVPLEIKSITCDNPAVLAQVDQEASSPYVHLRFLQVKFAGDAPATRQSALLTVETGVPGAERLEIPVTIAGRDAAPGN